MTNLERNPNVMFCVSTTVAKSLQRVKGFLMSQIKLAAILLCHWRFLLICRSAGARETLPQKAEVTNITPQVDCTKVEYRPATSWSLRPLHRTAPSVPHTEPAGNAGHNVTARIPPQCIRVCHSRRPTALPNRHWTSIVSMEHHILRPLTFLRPTPSRLTPIQPVASLTCAVPTIPAPRIAADLKPFRTYAFGFKVDTLGLGFEIATR